MKKERATQKSSPKSSHAHSTPHLEQLKAVICEEISQASKPVQFDVLQERCRCNGYTRAEVVNAVNALVLAEVLEFIRAPVDQRFNRLPGVRVYVRKAESEVQP